MDKEWTKNMLLVSITLIYLLDGTDCAITERLKSDFFNIYRGAAVQTRELQGDDVTPDQVGFYAFTKNNPTNYTKLDDANLDVLERHKVAFLVHGWTGSRERQWYEDLKNAILTNYPDYVVVQVDWREPADQLYYVSSINTYDVAKIIANLTIDLDENHGVPLEDVLFIGHSLGGQVSGFVGKLIQKQVGKKLKRIIALDPAGPLFEQRPDDKRLNKNDAEVVVAVHTDGGTFGFADPVGTIDFFMNGGRSQPGCKKIDLLDITSVTDPVVCDHKRAWAYFIEAVLNPKEFLAKRCGSWDDFKARKCEKESEAALGDLNIKTEGKYFVETNSEKPYARKASDNNGFNLLKLLQH